MKLPPLNSLRVFEAVGRRRSFLHAAEELHVTPGAVSKQIKLLEDFVGATLFERTSKPVKLSVAGQKYLEAVSHALLDLDHATSELIDQDEAKPLRIWGSRFFMQKWLVPRLPRFQEIDPGRAVVITTGLSTDPMPADVDIGIRFGHGRWPGLRAHHLVPMRLIPVCSPQYLAAHPSLQTSKDLSNHVLIQNLFRPDDWSIWLTSANMSEVPTQGQVSFESSLAAYNAALEGVGLAIGRVGFIETDLQAGRLVTPLPVATEAEGSFYLVYHDRGRLPARVPRFREWILDAISRESTLPEPAAPVCNEEEVASSLRGRLPLDTE